jgi:hypothetical protein
VAQIADSILAALGNAAPWVHGRDAGPRESRFLSLDARLAHSALGWSDRYDGTQIVERTAAWYREFGRGGDMRAACLAQIDDFIAGALPRPSLDARATVDPAAVSR